MKARVTLEKAVAQAVAHVSGKTRYKSLEAFAVYVLISTYKEVLMYPSAIVDISYVALFLKHERPWLMAGVQAAAGRFNLKVRNSCPDLPRSLSWKLHDANAAYV